MSEFRGFDRLKASIPLTALAALCVLASPVNAQTNQESNAPDELTKQDLEQIQEELDEAAKKRDNDSLLPFNTPDSPFYRAPEPAKQENPATKQTQPPLYQQNVEPPVNSENGERRRSSGNQKNYDRESQEGALKVFGPVFVFFGITAVLLVLSEPRN